MSQSRGPPPPVARKPLLNEPPLPSTAKPPPLTLPIPPTVKKLNSSLTDELNRKLATHLTLPVVPKKKPVVSHQTNLKKSFESSKDNDITNNITTELQNVFARRKDSTDANPFPKPDQGSTFTDVTKLADDPRNAEHLDNTSELSLSDNPLAGAEGDDIIPAPTFDDIPMDFMDDDGLPMMLPPPDMSMFDDESEPLNTEDGDCGYSDDEVTPPDFPPDGNEESDFGFFVPPPPPEPLLYETDEESGSDTNFQDNPDSYDIDNDENDVSGADYIQENDDFVNSVENFMDNVQSRCSSRSSGGVADQELFLPPPPPMMDDDDDDDDSGANDANDDNDDDENDDGDSVSSSSSISDDEDGSFCSEKIDTPAFVTSTAAGAPYSFISSEGVDAPAFVSSKGVDAPALVSSENFDAPAFVSSENFDAPAFVSSENFDAPAFVSSENFDAPTAFVSSEDVDAPTAFVSSEDVDAPAVLTSSHDYDAPTTLTLSEDFDAPSTLTSSQDVDALTTLTLSQEAQAPSTLTLSQEGNVSVSSPEDDVEKTEKETPSVPTKMKENTLLINSLNDVLKKRLSPAISSPKSNGSEYEANANADFHDGGDINMPMDPSIEKISSAKDPSIEKISSTHETDSDETKTAEDDLSEPVGISWSVSLTPTDRVEDNRACTPTKTTSVREDKDIVHKTSEESVLPSLMLNMSNDDSDLPATSNPVLAKNISDILKKQMTGSNPVSQTRKLSHTDKESGKEQVMSGQSTPAVDDSGFSTARSEDDLHTGKNNIRTRKTDELLFSALPATDAGPSPLNVSPQLSQISRTRTFSSSSDESSSSLSDDEETPKLNLRHMLLQHMKNTGTDSEDYDDDIGLDFDKDTIPRMDDISQDLTSDRETQLHEIDVSEWKVRDVCEWLELIGFSYLKQVFAEKQITGKILTDPHANILDKISFQNPDDREIIQSEVSALQMSNDEEMEMAILDALNKTNDSNPGNSFDASITVTPPSPGVRTSNPSRNLQSNDDTTSIELNTPTLQVNQESDNNSVNSYRNSETSKGPNRNSMNLDDLKKRLGNDVYDPSEEDWKTNEVSENDKQAKVKKKTKKKGFFSSFRRRKGKKEEPVPAMVEDDIEAISQSNPKGMVTVAYFPPNGGNEMEVKLLISTNMTSREVAVLCLDHLGLNEDVKCYYIVTVSQKNKKAQSTVLSSSDSPLMLQHKWNDEDENRFELRNRVDGYITIENEDVQHDELVTYKLGVSAETTASDVIPVVLKIFDEKEDAKYFWLAEGEDENRIPDSTLLLGLPLNGRKCNTFKLVNTSPRYLKQRRMSYSDARQVEDKIILLEQQVDKLSTLNEEYRRSEEHLVRENDRLNTEVKKQDDELIHKNNDVKSLQDDILSLNQKLRLSVTLGDGSLRDENEKLKQKITELQYNVKSAEQRAKASKDSKIVLEKEHEEAMKECKKLELLTTDLKEQLRHLQAEKTNSTSGSTEQMNKLYNENKDYLNRIRGLEDNLLEAEQRLAELQMGQDVESSEEVGELRHRLDSLESAALAKDTRILELEFKVQQKEREHKDMAEQLHDQSRKCREEVEIREDAEKKCEDVLLKMDSLRSQISEKDKQIQSAKTHNTKLEKKLNKQKYALENERTLKFNEFQEIDKRHQDELNMLMQKVQNADKLLKENDMSMKQATFELSKEKEDLVQQNSELEKKLSAKDMLIDRLESKVAKADLNMSAKLKDQGQLLLVKEEKLHKAEVEIAKLESEHASKVREMANTIRLKEGLVTKLEGRFKKLETSSAENVKKFERYVSEKDRLLQQVTADHDQTFKDLRGRARELEEIVKEKDSKLRDANRQYGEVKAAADARLKKREKEYKRQKFLLEKVLKLVNDKAPSLLRQLHDSLDGENQSVDSPRTSTTSPRRSVMTEEWC